jgi:hypothetical protein
MVDIPKLRSIRPGFAGRLLISAALVGGLDACCSPKLPSATDVSGPQADISSALEYTAITQKNYAKYITQQHNLNLGLGVLEIGLAGSGVGLAAVGGSKVAVAALATAAGSTIAFDQLIIGTPTNNPQLKADASAISALQCVISDAHAAIPASPVLRPENEALENGAVIAANLRSADSKLLVDVAAAGTSTPGCDSGSSGAPDLALALAEAALANDREEVIEDTIATLPTEIVDATNSIFYQTYASTASTVPDISQIKVSAAKLTGSAATPAGAATPPRPGPAPAVTPQCPLTVLRKDTALLNTDLLGAVPPKAGFAECTSMVQTASATMTTSSNGSKSATPSPATPDQSASAALTVLPSGEIYAKASQEQTIAVSGGVPEYFIEPVEKGIEIVAKPAVSGSQQVGLSLDTGVSSARVLIGDMAGNERLVTLSLTK